MDEKPQDDVDWTPWRWPRGFWIALFLIWPPLYVLSVLMVDHCTRNESGWRRTIAEIVCAPLEPIRKPFRRVAIKNQRYPVPYAALEDDLPADALKPEDER